MKNFDFKQDGLVNALTKDQMKKVLGGRAHSCTITPSNGSPYEAPDSGDGSAGNTACLAWISIHGGRCSYDCSFDGVG